MMKVATRTLTKGFDKLSLGITLALLCIVAFNIIARFLHNITDGSVSLMIPGAIELSKYALLFIVFTALPHASVSGMVRVDLISNNLPKKLAGFLDRLWLVLMAVFSAILVWLFSQKALLTFARGDSTQDLQIPLFYFYAVISIACATTALSCLVKAFESSISNAESSV
ncbi:MAG TPA: TRAP transporter small permease [Leucothrix sp.]|nr:TRAP transporter small permease [Leucothrix sp.]HIQ15695.1 TRAP transporter small permease [Leucothrix sp.]